jgi:tetratricopeptide (TPR) repeat protein
LKSLLLLLALATTGCVTMAPQTKELLASLPNISDHAQVEGVPFINQSAGYCGPATLAMAMQWAGTPITLEALAPEVYTPGMKGSLQEDMISASRRHGLNAIPIEGMEALLREIDAGHPVIIFENLALSWYPAWHYAVAFGYDLPAHQIILHSGPDTEKHWDLSKFERSWEYSDHWGLVVLPPGELSVSANELEHLKSAVGLEQIGQLDAAEKSYQAILSKWPLSLGALVGLGNIDYQRNDVAGAVHYLTLATQFHPDSLIAQHNLAVALSARF